MINNQNFLNIMFCLLFIARMIKITLNDRGEIYAKRKDRESKFYRVILNILQYIKGVSSYKCLISKFYLL